MYSYQSSLQSAPPKYRPLDGLVSPYGQYPASHTDAFNSRAGQAAADYNVARDRGNTDYGLDFQRAQNALVLQGLNTLAGQRDQQQDVHQSRLDLMRGLRNNIIGGLF